MISALIVCLITNGCYSVVHIHEQSLREMSSAVESSCLEAVQEAQYNENSSKDDLFDSFRLGISSTCGCYITWIAMNTGKHTGHVEN